MTTVRRVAIATTAASRCLAPIWQPGWVRGIPVGVVVASFVASAAARILPCRGEATVTVFDLTL